MFSKKNFYYIMKAKEGLRNMRKNEQRLPIDIAIGDELKSLRLARGMSLQYIADRVGITRQSVHAYEQGRASISVQNLIKICDLYGVKYYDLLEKVARYAYRGTE